MRDSPYLKPCRLGQVIAAIQVLAYYKFYRLNVENWAERITGELKQADTIKTIENVFADHPEFFQLTMDGNRTRAALVARRSFTRSYDVDADKELPIEEVMARRGDDKAWSRLSRRPLTPGETAVLIQTATELHNRAVEQGKAGRWWVPLASAGIGFAGGIAATLAGAMVSGMGTP